MPFFCAAAGLELLLLLRSHDLIHRVLGAPNHGVFGLTQDSHRMWSGVTCHVCAMLLQQGAFNSHVIGSAAFHAANNACGVVCISPAPQQSRHGSGLSTTPHTVPAIGGRGEEPADRAGTAGTSSHFVRFCRVRSLVCWHHGEGATLAPGPHAPRVAPTATTQYYGWWGKPGSRQGACSSSRRR